jgi:hypothetical protein
MAPQVGLEPTTLRLTAGCSAIELLRSVVSRALGDALELNIRNYITIISLHLWIAGTGFALLRDLERPTRMVILTRILSMFIAVE